MEEQPSETGLSYKEKAYYHYHRLFCEILRVIKTSVPEQEKIDYFHQEMIATRIKLTKEYEAHYGKPEPSS